MKIFPQKIGIDISCNLHEMSKPTFFFGGGGGVEGEEINLLFACQDLQ